MFQTITTRHLEALLDSGGNYILIDEREPDEFAEGHLEGAVNLPFSEFPQAFLNLPVNRKLILYCTHGGNSIQAARDLSRRGFYAVNVYGGLSYYRGRHFITG